jgi:hypothetical protein
MVKQQALGITQEVFWERLGYSPTKISRMKAMQTADSRLARRQRRRRRPGRARPATSLPRPSPAQAVPA